MDRADHRHRRSSQYDLSWVLSLDMGPNPLWQLEDLLPDLGIEPGMRVLDLGCGKGSTSVFVAEQTGAQVTACDLWMSEQELAAHLTQAGVGDRVVPVNADARRLPFPDESFDVVVSVDAFEYFGTDVRAVPSILRTLVPGGRIGMSTPALRIDPYEQGPPSYVTDVVGWEAAAWHSPGWWARHWQLSRQLEGIRARMQPDGREDWLRWCRAAGEAVDSPVVRMLQ